MIACLEADRKLTVIVDGMTHTEGARWHNERLFFADLYTHSIYSVDEDGGDLRVEVHLDSPPCGSGWLPDGRMLVVHQQPRHVLRREHDGSLVLHADCSRFTNHELNDMIVDGDGRAWVGGWGFNIMKGEALRPMPILRIDPDGTVTQVTEPLHFPNGCALIADRTLVVAESFGERLSAFDIGADGKLSERRDWARFGAVPTSDDLLEVIGSINMGSDGMSEVDAEGALWVADFVRGRAVRVREGGEILDEVSTGDLNCYACALGGRDGRTLFLLATPAEFDPELRRNDPRSRIYSVTVKVPLARSSV